MPIACQNVIRCHPKSVGVSQFHKPLIDEITAFFRENQLLSREEFHHIVTRVRRP
jgi:hypothetical protein